MGKIRGTLRTRRHIFVLLPTTKSLDKSFVFKNDDAKEGLKNMTRLAWAQEVPGSNPGAPTTNSLNYLRLFLHSISTSIELGNIWEQLICEHVHSINSMGIGAAQTRPLLRSTTMALTVLSPRGPRRRVHQAGSHTTDTRSAPIGIPGPAAATTSKCQRPSRFYPWACWLRARAETTDVSQVMITGYPSTSNTRFSIRNRPRRNR